MFQFGALNPNPGNDRRKQLLQTLMQQFMQKQGAGMPGQPAPPTAAPFHASRPTFGTANRESGANRSPGTGLTHPMMIPRAIMDMLGPGGANRGASDVMSPQAGMPVPGLGRGGALPAAIDPGSRIMPGGPAGLASPSPGGAGTPAPTPAPTPQQQAAAAAAGAGAGAAQIAALQSAPNQILAPVVNPNTPGDAFAGTGSFTTPSGLVPLGNGVFVDPATGMIHGVPGPTLGSMPHLGRLGYQ